MLNSKKNASSKSIEGIYLAELHYYTHLKIADMLGHVGMSEWPNYHSSDVKVRSLKFIQLPSGKPT